MDMGLALYDEKPAPLTDESTEEDKYYHDSWEKSNRLAFKYLWMAISPDIRESLPATDSVKELFKHVKDASITADKSMAGNYMTQLTGSKFTAGSVHDYFVKVTSIAAKLKALGSPVHDDFLITLIMNGLPPKYQMFHVNYNAQKDQWDLHQLKSALIQEETRLKNQLGNEAVNLVTANQGNKKKNKPKKRKEVVAPKALTPNPEIPETKKPECKFCDQSGHWQKACPKFKAWLERKGNFSFVCHESNLLEVPKNTWWLDSGCTTHVSNSL